MPLDLGNEEWIAISHRLLKELHQNYETALQRDCGRLTRYTNHLIKDIDNRCNNLIREQNILMERRQILLDMSNRFTLSSEQRSAPDHDVQLARVLELHFQAKESAANQLST